MTGLKQSRVSEALGINRANFVALLDELEQRKLARRAPAPGDRRSNALFLTPKGESFLKDAYRHLLTQHEKRVETVLGSADKQQLLGLLEKRRFVVAMYTNPTLSREEFYDLLLHKLGIECSSSLKSRQLIALQESLERNRADGRPTVLIVDEAQRLSSALLEEIRLLLKQPGFHRRRSTAKRRIECQAVVRAIPKHKCTSVPALLYHASLVRRRQSSMRILRPHAQFRSHCTDARRFVTA